MTETTELDPTLAVVAELLDRELGSLGADVAATPEALLWTALPGVVNPMGTLALHLCGNLRHFIGALLGDDGYVRDRVAEFARRDASGDELVAEIARTREAVAKALQGLDPNRLDQPMEGLPERYAGRSARFFLIQLALHAAWHRGQGDYLRRALVAMDQAEDV